MGYDIYLYRKEVKGKFPSDFEFMENEELIEPFSIHQFNTLKATLLACGYQIENESEKYVSFNYKGSEHGIIVNLSEKVLFFSSGFSEEAITEIQFPIERRK